MTYSDLFGIDFRDIGNVAAMASTVDLHKSPLQTFNHTYVYPSPFDKPLPKCPWGRPTLRRCMPRIIDDAASDSYTCVADIHLWARNELRDFRCALTAERTPKSPS